MGLIGEIAQKLLDSVASSFVTVGFLPHPWVVDELFGRKIPICAQCPITQRATLPPFLSKTEILSGVVKSRPSRK